jgi:hypothetical protein
MIQFPDVKEWVFSYQSIHDQKRLLMGASKVVAVSIGDTGELSAIPVDFNAPAAKGATIDVKNVGYGLSSVRGLLPYVIAYEIESSNGFMGVLLIQDPDNSYKGGKRCVFFRV